MPKRILIAEDEASVRNAVRTFIESRTQYEVSEAIDGNEAIHKAQALLGGFGPADADCERDRSCRTA